MHTSSLRYVCGWLLFLSTPRLMLLHLFFAVSSFANIAVSCTFAVEIIVEFFGDVVNNHCVEPLPVGCINFTFCFTASDI